MRLPVFLYNFSKTYIPAVILLCLFYLFTNNVSNIAKAISHPKKTEKQTILATTPPPKPPDSASKKPIAPKPKPTPETPKYYYLVEFTTGGSMKASAVNINNNIVKVFIENGYDMTISKSDIKSIKKYRL